MSLRLRLLVSIAFVLAFTLIVGGGLIYWHSVEKVDTEMDAALDVSVRTVRNATDDAEEAVNPLRQLELLVEDFDGNRHVRALLMNSDGVSIATSMILAPSHPAPDWFNRLLAREPTVVHIYLPPAFAKYGSILLATDSHNEIAEAWSDCLLTLGILAIFCMLVLALVYVILDSPLRSLRNMAAAFRRVGDGDYSPRIAETGARELAELSRGFNEMMVRLSAMEHQNRRLQAQLATVQEEERADLARDLHDEIGPLLFALNIDLSTLQRQDWDHAKEKITAHFEAMSGTIAEMQLHVRSMLGKLRPAVLLDLGLTHAVTNLVAFWGKRHADVCVNVELESDSFGEVLDATIYRVLQEALNNALRHGHPSLIEIKVRRGRDGRVEVEVSDNGVGLAVPNRDFGFGLTGMKERVESVGGSLVVANRIGGHGVVVLAKLPAETNEDELIKEHA